MRRQKIPFDELILACSEVRKRVSQYSPIQRAELLKRAKALIAAGKKKSRR